MSKGYEENYFFVFRDDAVTYNELETRVQLRKRRVQGYGHQVTLRFAKGLIWSGAEKLLIENYVWNFL